MREVPWFEADHARLVLEYVLMGHAHPEFSLRWLDMRPVWEGELREQIPGFETLPLQVRLRYPPGYPIRPVMVVPLAPELPPDRLGHAWHRFDGGNLCIGDPTRWEPTFTAVDVVAKVSDWYFNYLACDLGLIDAMPDVGRAVLRDSGAGD